LFWWDRKWISSTVSIFMHSHKICCAGCIRVFLRGWCFRPRLPLLDCLLNELHPAAWTPPGLAVTSLHECDAYECWAKAGLPWSCRLAAAYHLCYHIPQHQHIVQRIRDVRVLTNLSRKNFISLFYPGWTPKRICGLCMTSRIHSHHKPRTWSPQRSVPTNSL
jgi:hypothetical protein